MTAETTMEKRRYFIINVIYVTLIIAIVYFLIRYALGILMPFMIGFVVALLLKPIINFVSGKLRIPRKVAAVFLVLLTYGAAGIFLSWIGVKVFDAIKDVITKLPELYQLNIGPVVYQIFNHTEEVLAELDPTIAQTIGSIAASLSQSMESIILNISSTVIDFLSSAVSSVPGFIMAVVFAVISSLFLTIDYTRIMGYVAKLFPPPKQRILAEVKTVVIGIGFKYIKAYATLMTITFMELAVGLSILRVEGSLGIAALIAFIDLLPVFGTGGVVIPWIIIELIKGNASFAAGLTTMYLIITIVRNLLEPKLVGKQIGLHPLAMLISIYVGAKVFGLIGFFVLPVIVVIIKHLYDNGKIYFFGHPDNSPPDETAS